MLKRLSDAHGLCDSQYLIVSSLITLILYDNSVNPWYNLKTPICKYNNRNYPEFGKRFPDLWLNI